MRIYAQEKPGSSDDDDTWEDDGDLPLPYDFSLALDLWVAFDRHGVMPLAGGYLDQPQAWRAMVHVFNQRFNRARRAQAEEVDYQKLLGEDAAPVAEGWGGLMGA